MEKNVIQLTSFSLKEIDRLVENLCAELVSYSTEHSKLKFLLEKYNIFLSRLEDAVSIQSKIDRIFYHIRFFHKKEKIKLHKVIEKLCVSIHQANRKIGDDYFLKRKFGEILFKQKRYNPWLKEYITCYYPYNPTSHTNISDDDLNQYNSFFETPLTIAMYKGHRDIVQKYINSSSSIQKACSNLEHFGLFISPTIFRDIVRYVDMMHILYYKAENVESLLEITTDKTLYNCLRLNLQCLTNLVKEDNIPLILEEYFYRESYVLLKIFLSSLFVKIFLSKNTLNTHTIQSYRSFPSDYFDLFIKAALLRNTNLLKFLYDTVPATLFGDNTKNKRTVMKYILNKLITEEHRSYVKFFIRLAIKKNWLKGISDIRELIQETLNDDYKHGGSIISLLNKDKKQTKALLIRYGASFCKFG